MATEPDFYRDGNSKKINIADANSQFGKTTATTPTSSSGLASLLDSPQLANLGTSFNLRGEGTSIDSKGFLTSLQKDPAQLHQFLVRLYNAGLYPTDVYKGNTMPNFDVVDADAANAIVTALGQSAFSNVGLYDLLDSRTNAGMGQTGGGNFYKINLDDPASLRQAANKVGQALLGRDLSDDEANKYAQSISGKEYSNQASVIGAQEANAKSVFDAATGGLADFSGHKIAADSLNRVQALAQTFPGLHMTSGYRDKESNARAGGVKNSDHLTGEATDWVGSAKDMNAARAWALAHGAKQVLIHNAGSGIHLHIAWKAGGSGDQIDPLKDPAGALAQQESNARGGGLSTDGGLEPLSPDQYLPSTTATETAVDPAADLAEQERKDHPQEAGAHDVANTFASFLNILKGGI